MGQHMDQHGPLGNFDEGKQHSQFMAETYKICLHKMTCSYCAFY